MTPRPASHMNLLWFNLAMDEEHRLSFSVKWVRAVAERVASVHVITMQKGRATVPPNVTVHSLGKEKGFSEPRRLVEFYRVMASTLRTHRIDACFSHMNPLFTVLGTPLLRLSDVPTVTWYAHRQLSTMVKLAHHCSTRVVSSVAAAYPYKRDKLTLIGQGVDTELFRPDGKNPDQGLVLSVGRLSPIKDLLTLVDALYRLKQRGIRLRCVLIGGVPERDAQYARGIREQITLLGLDDVFTLAGPLPQEEVAPWGRRCDVHVNLCPTGAVDKAALEVMACGRPGVVANEAFIEVLGEHTHRLLFRHGDASDLASKLEDLLALPVAERDAIGRSLRARVLDLHRFDQLIDRLTRILEEVQGRAHESVRPSRSAV